MFPRLLLLAFLLTPAVPLCGQSVTLTVDATHDLHAIPAEVYGVNDDIFAGATVHRHGGNRMTGFNWENNASNAGSDYNQQSDDYLGASVGIGDSQKPGAVLDAWLAADRAASLHTIITLPLAGYVAADMNGPVSQAETAPSARWKQIVVNKSTALSLTPDATDAYVYLDEMVNYLTTKYGLSTAGGVTAYNMDNEPALWPSTHPRIHPNATQYAELAAKNIAAATMVTRLDPGAQVYGPTLYGWEAYLNLQNAPDAAGFNNTYGIFANYYLAQMNAASASAGRRLLHRFDLHWYPEATGDNRIVFGSSPGTNNDIDARLQAPRSLWDAAYVEKSWITQYTTNGQGIQLLPRLQGNIDQYYPGTGIVLTEYDYGATDHISGGVAEADVLGVLGEHQTAGNFWPILSDSSYVAAAFKLYRNYDGAGAAFGNLSLAATASDNSAAGVHAARVGSGGTKLTVVVINRSRTASCAAQVNFTLPNGQTLASVKTYRLTPAGGAQVQAGSALTPSGAGFADTLPAMSATLYEVQLSAAPVITSRTAANGYVGTALGFRITASGGPTSFNAANLPPGLGLNHSSGLISGTPTTAGTYNVTVSATNASGTGSGTLAFTIQGKPVITSAATARGKVGTALGFRITATNSPTSFGATGLPPGLTLGSRGLIAGTPTTAGTYNVTVSATNAEGTGSAALMFTTSP